MQTAPPIIEPSRCAPRGYGAKLFFSANSWNITHLNIGLRTFPEKFCSMVIATTKLS